jgi:uncharacterized protein (DUF1330 family)
VPGVPGPRGMLTWVHSIAIEVHMSAYFMVQNTIKDEAQYQKYVQAVVPFIATFAGKLVARRAKVEVLEGDHDERPVVMFEFPNMEAISAFWNSPDYAPIKKLREGIATMNIWAFAGS